MLRYPYLSVALCAVKPAAQNARAVAEKTDRAHA
jgi:hypothetical protein